MSKIFNLNKKTDVQTHNSELRLVDLTTNKHFPSPIREWNNSIYVYNKNVLNLIPYSSELSEKLIKSYFNLYNKKVEKRIRTRKLLFRLKRLSCNKIFISNAEFKHTNNVVLINLYVFNRQKKNYLLKMRKKYIKLFLKKIKLKKKFLDRLQNINNNILFKLLVRNTLKLNRANTSKYIEKMYWKSIKLLSHNNLISSSKLKTRYLTKYFKLLLEKSFKKFRLYLYYRRLLYINNSKFNYNYLHILKNNLEKLYNKNVEFNIINLKRFYLNSDILTETLKLKVMKNRKKLLKFMTKIKNKIKTQNKKLSILKNVLWSNRKIEYDGDFYNIKPSISNIKKEKLFTKFLVNNLKYRKVTGFRLEARGRLTRRFTASRSLFKVRYKGNLLNIESSSKKLFSVLLKGNLRSNVQFTKLSSKTRIGSFGIKGWVSGN